LKLGSLTVLNQNRYILISIESVNYISRLLRNKSINSSEPIYSIKYLNSINGVVNKYANIIDRCVG